MRRRPRPTAVPISSSCGRKGRLDEFLLEERRNQAMAKTIVTGESAQDFKQDADPQ
jgi:hypothetical protein